MHESSYRNMHRCQKKYGNKTNTVLDVGGADVNNTDKLSYRKIFKNYTTLDLENADIILQDPYKFPIPDNSFDVVISGQMMEHCPFFWLTMEEMVRVARKHIFLIVPSAGAVHRYPVDCWRFYPDSGQALADYTHVTLLECYRDKAEPWKDLVSVYEL